MSPSRHSPWCRRRQRPKSIRPTRSKSATSWQLRGNVQTCLMDFGHEWVSLTASRRCQLTWLQLRRIVRSLSKDAIIPIKIISLGVPFLSPGLLNTLFFGISAEDWWASCSPFRISHFRRSCCDYITHAPFYRPTAWLPVCLCQRMMDSGFQVATPVHRSLAGNSSSHRL